MIFSTDELKIEHPRIYLGGNSFPDAKDIYHTNVSHSCLHSVIAPGEAGASLWRPGR